MYELPDELWQLIKDFMIDWKRKHQEKMKILEKYIICDKTIHTRWQLFPPYPNTNDIIREEYFFRPDWAPRPNLPLVSIEKRPLVSSDFLNNPNSVIIDTLSTMVVNKNY